ncbi:hypothetical protein DSLASN_08470 [Desulfoluna limicola]|uniref:DUF4136 domain-containing protein n=1 Tax=Desulfoluna limicola TaxID=2810562 RepID=A0ABN6F107_9BACT|nr:DUF4136 domain-containing protein [Desulfoluna limicola]BCS95215.1 hypothetical protein DSLASN_08470 [Desulfoluna limicola]
MIRKHALLFVIAFIFLAGCTTAPVSDIKLKSKADPKVNFNGYNTFAWLGSASILNDPEGKWEPPGFDADAEIKFLIDRELRKRGMSKSSANPDLLVAFAAGVDMDALDLMVDPETHSEIQENLPKGGLLIAFVDPDTGFVIWLGMAKAEVQQGIDGLTIKARLDYAVTKLLKKIPK